MDFTIPEEYKQLQLLVRRFVKDELMPLEKEVEEKDDVPKEMMDRLRKRAIEIGIYALAMPEEYGGGGIGPLGMCFVYEEMGKTIVPFMGLVGGGSDLLLHGTEEQKQKYLLPSIRGDISGCFALTEPGAGADAAGIQTKAVRDGDAYILNGTKHFISGADRADYAITFAVTDKTRGARGITAFIIDLKSPGISITPQPKLGRRGSHTCQVVYEDLVVPASNVLGKENEGFYGAMQNLGFGRLHIASRCVGSAELLLDMAIRYAKQRVTFGRPLAERQAIQWMLVDTAVDIFASRMMTYNTAWEAEQGIDVRSKMAMVKLFASEMAFRAADRTMQIHGGMGYMKELPIERWFRDLRALMIGEGPSEIMRHIIARNLLRD